MPVLDYINTYRREIAGFFANSTAADEAPRRPPSSHKLLHYVRISNPINPETLTDYEHRISTNRGNPYLVPGGYSTSSPGCPCSAAICARATLSRRSALLLRPRWLRC